MSSIHGGHCPFPYAVIISVLNLLHHSRTVLEADLVGSSHLSGGSLAHAVQYLVKYIDLFLTQRIFKRNSLCYVCRGCCGYVRSSEVCVSSAETRAFHDFGACVEEVKPVCMGGGEVFGIYQNYTL